MGETVEAAGTGDLVKKYQAQLKGFIRKRVSSKEDAEDILQDVLYQLVRADSLLRPIEQISAWLYKVARNTIIDRRRKKKEGPLPESWEDGEEHSLSEFSEILFDPSSSPETEYLKALVWKKLETALCELPEEQRDIFELTELQGLSFKEVSDGTGVPVNTLISRKRYAVLYLRKQLAVLYNELMIY